MRLLVLLFCCLWLVFADYPRDPYSELGIKKSASAKDIKRAYKALAREWHPDKNSNPDAQDKFVSITKAYEILSDPLKKERYDKFGTFDDSPHGRGGGHHGFGGFDPFFNGFGGFGGQDDDLFVKQRISIRQYVHGILDKSHEQPFILYVYSNYCQLCFQLKSVWKSATDDLEPLGYGVGTVNAMIDGNLVEKLRISRVPAIVAIVEGRVIHLRNDMRTLSARGIRLFARDVIPKTFLLPINTYDKLKRFVDQWSSSNKVSVLIMGSLGDPRTRYLLTAMKFAHFARFAYVHLGENTAEIASMRHALSIKCTQCDNVLIFNDNPENGPIARLSISSGSQMTMESLTQFVNENKLLTMPRLSSMHFLDDLCPVSSRNPRHLCFILPIVDGSEDASLLEKWRQYTAKVSKNFTARNVRLTYIYVNKQSEWMRPFLEKANVAQSSGRDVLVIWRFEHVKARFSWLAGAWDGNETTMENSVEEVLAQRIRLEHTAAVTDLVDEYTPSLWTRMTRAAIRMCESAWFHLTKEEAYPVLSVVGTFVIIIILGYFVNMTNQQDPKMKKERPRKGSMEDWHPEDPTSKKESEKGLNPGAKIKRVMSVMTPLMHELRAESYFGMIRLLKPGCRSLVVLVDEESKDRLLTQFAQYIYPLRNNKTFSFGYLMVDKNLPWFRKLLEHTLPLADGATQVNGSLCEKLKGINPRQTIGTVLALCGWKLYFSIYHPMHTTGKNRHFLGFDDEDSDSFSDSDGDEEKGTKEEQAMLRGSSSNVNTDNVLNSFPNWLDRLLEGSIRRYYIPEWPENLK